MTTTAAPLNASPIPTDAVGTSALGTTTAGSSFAGETGTDIFAQIFARLLSTNPSETLNLASPSLATPALLPGGPAIQNLPTTQAPATKPAATTTNVEQIPSFESIQAFSTALASFLSAVPGKGGVEEGTKPGPADPTDGSAALSLENLGDLLSPGVLTGPVVDLTALPTQANTTAATETPPALAAAASPAPTTLPAGESIFAAVARTLPEDRPAPKGRLQPFQPGLQGSARRVGDDLSLKGESNPTSLAGMGTSVSLESILGGGRNNRIVVDKAILKQVDKLLGRSPQADLVAERGVSVLTPEELKTTSTTVEDRNATALARVDRGEFVNRVMQALERAHIEQPKRIEVELHPPALGKLKVQVIERNGELTARIEVHSQATRSLLLDNLPTLDRNLGEHGVQIQRFQVDQTNTGYSSLGDSPKEQPQQNLTGQDQREHPRSTGFFNPVDEDAERGPPLSLAELLGLADGMDRLI